MPRSIALATALLALIPAPTRAQNFTQITSGDAVTDLAYSEGALWEDIDGDGHLDLFVANIVNQDNLLYTNDGDGNLTLVPGGPVVTDGGFSYGGCLADFDNDGDADLFVENGGSSSSVVNFFYRNDGGSFAKISTGILVTDPGGSWSSSTADYDLDGDLDIFVANYNQNNALYRNDGSLAFTKITTGPVVTDGGQSLGSAWGDFDGDGDPDLFVANSDFGSGVANFLYRNDGGGAFTRDTTSLVATTTRSSVGGSWGDPDNDGDLDLLVANYSGQNNQFFRNDGGGVFANRTSAAGLAHGGSSVCGAFADWNNDGQLDLFVSNDLNANNLLYRNDGGAVFGRITTGPVVTGGGRSNGSSWADTDSDGDLDLYVTNGDQPGAQSNYYYRNDGSGGANHWLHVRCVGVQSNRSAIGTRLRAKAVIGGSPVWQLREIFGQTGYNAQNSLVAEFGMGDATVVDSLVIDWPLGQRDVYTSVPVDRLLRLVEGMNPTGISPTGTGARSRVALAPSRPNPFHEAASIRYSLRRPTHVRLTLHDVAGRLVRHVLSEPRSAGEHETVLRRDNLPAGTYYLVLRADGEVASRPIQVLR